MTSVIVRKKMNTICAERDDVAAVIAAKLDIEPQVIIAALDAPEGDKLHVWVMEGEHEIDVVDTSGEHDG